MRASYRTSCQPLRLRDRVAVCCGALLKLYALIALIHLCCSDLNLQPVHVRPRFHQT